MVLDAKTRHHVTRQLDVNRPLVAQDGVKHTVDLLKGGLRVAQHCGGYRQLFKDFSLRVEFPYLVVKEWVFLTFLHAGRTTDHHHRRLLGKSPGSRIGYFEPAHAIGHADHTETPNARVGVRGETCALLVARGHHLELAGNKLIVETEDIIAGDPKHVADAERMQTRDQIFPDRLPSLRGAFRRKHSNLDDDQILTWSATECRDARSSRN